MSARETCVGAGRTAVSRLGRLAWCGRAVVSAFRLVGLVVLVSGWDVVSLEMIVGFGTMPLICDWRAGVCGGGPGELDL